VPIVASELAGYDHPQATFGNNSAISEKEHRQGMPRH
jgi:hypothetical protein